MRICVATLNCRNRSTRWRERARLLTTQLAELRPDAIGLQEMRRWPNQAGWIAAAVSVAGGPGYSVDRAFKGGLRSVWEGVALLARLPVVERDSLRLRPQRRVAQFVRLLLPDGSPLDVYNTHLSWIGETARQRQAEQVLAWMDTRPGTAQVLLGDFNAEPTAPSVALVRSRLRSAHADVHGREPEGTVPTPLRGGGRARVVDYVFVNELITVHDAWVTFQAADPNDATLVASDHFGLAATVSVQGGPRP